MDNRITKSRLKILLSYDLIKLFALILAGVVLWSLLFTIFGASLSEGQSFNVYWYNVNVYENELQEMLDADGEGGFKTYETYETTTYNFGMYSPSNTTMPQQFAAWSSVGQLDILFLSGAADIEETEQNEKGETVTVKRSLVDNYGDHFIALSGLAESAVRYCKDNGGYTVDGKPQTDDKAKQFFHSRQRKSNFYRHEIFTEDMEVERLEKIWNAAKKLDKWLNDETLDIWATKTVTVGGVSEEVICGIDMGKLEKVGANAQTGKTSSSLCGYNAALKEEGESVAEGVVLAVMDNKSKQPHGIYESLLFVVAVVENYSSLS